MPLTWKTLSIVLISFSNELKENGKDIQTVGALGWQDKWILTAPGWGVRACVCFSFLKVSLDN